MAHTSFVTASDFNVSPYRLPNLSVNTEFIPFVQQQEEEILLKLLGPTLYQAFIDGLNEEAVEDRWAKLRDGDTYELDGKVWKWGGMVKMLKPNIFYEWAKVKPYTFGESGLTIPKPENSVVVNPVVTLVRAWNDFCVKAGSPYVHNPLYGTKYNTLYGYLYVQSLEGAEGTFDDTFDETFDDFDAYLQFYFEPQKKMNEFGF